MLQLLKVGFQGPFPAPACNSASGVQVHEPRRDRIRHWILASTSRQHSLSTCNLVLDRRLHFYVAGNAAKTWKAKYVEMNWTTSTGICNIALGSWNTTDIGHLPGDKRNVGLDDEARPESGKPGEKLVLVRI